MNKNKQIIVDLIATKPKHYAKMVKGNAELNQWVVDNCVIQTDSYAEMIYNAVTNRANICPAGNTYKFKSINDDYAFCGPAGKCACAKASVSAKVALTKSAHTSDQKSATQKKRVSTTLSKYGVTNNAQTKTATAARAEYFGNLIRKPKTIKTSAYTKLSIKFKQVANIEFITTEEQYVGVSNHIHYAFKCGTCDTLFNDYIDNGHTPVCKHCNPAVPTYVSNQEVEVFNFVKLIVGVKTVIQSDRSIIAPYELDIVIPELKIAIEYCGLYWHSEMHKSDPKYHVKKMQLCNAAGYRLITIFEDEWLLKTDIVKNRLVHILNVSTDKIYARQTVIKQLAYAEAKKFVNENHIQGHTIFKYGYGAYYKDVLVAVMTFGTPRYVTTGGYELLRFCSNKAVIGGASKLLAHFVKTMSPSMLISYCDLRWGNGNLYKTLGFVEQPVTGPGYCYTDFINRFHRSNFTKQKLVSNGADASLTEVEIMRSKKMYKIWDCGNKKYLLDLS